MCSVELDLRGFDLRAAVLVKQTSCKAYCLTFTKRSTSFCCVTIELVLPHSQLSAAIKSVCCKGRYGWKNEPYDVLLTFAHSRGLPFHTLPKMSRGRPTKASKLLLSLVRSSSCRESVAARAANEGEPQSSRVCSRPGKSETREYWNVQSFSTGWP
jgi:hypothetical protein